MDWLPSILNRTILNLNVAMRILVDRFRDIDKSGDLVELSVYYGLFDGGIVRMPIVQGMANPVENDGNRIVSDNVWDVHFIVS
jgi:hypothetical protein